MVLKKKEMTCGHQTGQQRKTAVDEKKHCKSCEVKIQKQ